MPGYDRQETYIIPGAAEILQYHLKWYQTCRKAYEGAELALDSEMCGSDFMYAICQISQVRQNMDVGSRTD